MTNEEKAEKIAIALEQEDRYVAMPETRSLGIEIIARTLNEIASSGADDDCVHGDKDWPMRRCRDCGAKLYETTAGVIRVDRREEIASKPEPDVVGRQGMEAIHGVAMSLIDGMRQVAAALDMGELEELDDAIVDRAREVMAALTQAESDKNWLRAQRDTAEARLTEAVALLAAAQDYVKGGCAHGATGRHMNSPAGRLCERIANALATTEQSTGERTCPDGEQLQAWAERRAAVETEVVATTESAQGQEGERRPHQERDGSERRAEVVAEPTRTVLKAWVSPTGESVVATSRSEPATPEPTPMETDESYRARIVDAYGMWGAFGTVVIESSGAALDQAGESIGVKRNPPESRAWGGACYAFVGLYTGYCGQPIPCPDHSGVPPEADRPPESVPTETPTCAINDPNCGGDYAGHCMPKLPLTAAADPAVVPEMVEDDCYAHDLLQQAQATIDALRTALTKAEEELERLQRAFDNRQWYCRDMEDTLTQIGTALGAPKRDADALIAAAQALQSTLREREDIGAALERIEFALLVPQDNDDGPDDVATRVIATVSALHTTIACLRSELAQWRFVADERGGHYLSVPTGDKWYPEAAFRAEVEELRRAIREVWPHLTGHCFEGANPACHGTMRDILSAVVSGLPYATEENR